MSFRTITLEYLDIEASFLPPVYYIFLLSVCVFVCVSVCVHVSFCLCICMSLQAITFECLAVETSFLVWWDILTISRSSLIVKVTGVKVKLTLVNLAS